jgi:2-phosphosulfolactate phosphatase
MSAARFLPATQASAATGAVVVVDVLRAFTTAAYAFAAGARRIWLVESADDALALKADRPGTLAMGEDRGRRLPGFDFANSPSEIAAQDLTGCDLVQRTSAGTRGVVAATSATRRWCASLVCGSATAAAVNASGLGAPAYVITGWFGDERPGHDDMETARLIERARTGLPVRATETAQAVANSREAAVTLALGTEHVDPADVELATRVDFFDFAMEARQTPRGLELTRTNLADPRGGRTGPD